MSISKKMHALLSEAKAKPDMSWIKTGAEAVPADGSKRRVKITYASQSEDTVEYTDLKDGKEYEKDFFSFWSRYAPGDAKLKGSDRSWIRVGQKVTSADGDGHMALITKVTKTDVEYRDLKTDKEYERNIAAFFVRWMPVED